MNLQSECLEQTNLQDSLRLLIYLIFNHFSNSARVANSPLTENKVGRIPRNTKHNSNQLVSSLSATFCFSSLPKLEMKVKY